MLLARAGARVLMLERTPYGSDTLSTHALMRAGVLQLSRWGVLGEVVGAGTPPVRRVRFHYGDETVQVSVRPIPGVDALYAPRRHVLDRILVDAAVAAGVEVRHGVAVLGLTRDADGRVDGVRARPLRGKRFDVRARIVIGADGIRSAVADGVGSRVERRGSQASAALYGYYAGLPSAGYEWAYAGQAAAGMIATGDGLSCVFVCATPQRMQVLRREGADSAFRALFAEAAPAHIDRLDASTRVGRVRGWAGARGHLRRSWGPGWALVGDSGYFKDPISAHGMTDALRDAELLADAVLSAWSGGILEADALARYQALRDALSTRLFDASDRIAAYDWDRSRIQQLGREVSAAMADEVELVQTLPDRRVGAGSTGFMPTDRALVRR
jgi:2-polyprenyl-6-methoxyphenol hydroxylase-like FAD-dependent oxidoreductase